MQSLLLGLVLLVAAAVVILGRQRKGLRRLRRRLDAATEELQRLQKSFALFAPQEVVERIAGGGSIKAEKRDVTVLFADVVGFTKLGESLEPDVLLSILNGYFARMSAVIGEHRGHVAKFIGDGLMALFGALEPNPWQANDAVHAALGMRSALRRYNDELARNGLPPLRVGIGIHRGPAVAGIVGSHRLVEFTVVGSPVNLASRVERLTRAYGVDVLVTAEVCRHLDQRFVLRSLGPASARGFTERVEVFTVEGFADAQPGAG